MGVQIGERGQNSQADLDPWGSNFDRGVQIWGVQIREDTGLKNIVRYTEDFLLQFDVVLIVCYIKQYCNSDRIHYYRHFGIEILLFSLLRRFGDTRPGLVVSVVPFRVCHDPMELLSEFFKSLPEVHLQEIFLFGTSVATRLPV